MYLADADFKELFEREKERKNPLDKRFIAMSNAILKALPNWQLEAKKLFFLCLSQYQFNKTDNPNIIVLNKKDVIEKLEIHPSKGGAYLRQLAKTMAKKSWIERTIATDTNGDAELWDDGFIFVGASSSKATISIELNPKYQSQFQELSANFTMLWSDDLIKIGTTQTMKLYEELRRIYDTRYLVNRVDFKTSQLKKIFGLSKDDYMNKKSGMFDRYNFEKYCLDKAINEINEKCEAVKIMIHENGKGYTKTKEFGGKIDTYVIQYRCSTRVVEKELLELSSDPPEGQTTIYDDFN